MKRRTRARQHGSTHLNPYIMRVERSWKSLSSARPPAARAPSLLLVASEYGMGQLCKGGTWACCAQIGSPWPADGSYATATRRCMRCGSNAHKVGLSAHLQECTQPSRLSILPHAIYRSTWRSPVRLVGWCVHVAAFVAQWPWSRCEPSLCLRALQRFRPLRLVPSIASEDSKQRTRPPWHARPKACA